MRAKEAVAIARLRLISHWRESHTELQKSLSEDALAIAEPGV
jgi:hypothetical protein